MIIFEGINKGLINTLLSDFKFWLFFSLILSVPIGLSSALFLYTLEWVTEFRESNLWIISGLPVVGLLIGWLYKNTDSRASLGNNLIFQEYSLPVKTMPFIMAPLILISTLLTHLVGASAGREGTAVQMGAVIADRFHKFGEKYSQNRSLFLIAGVGAGFASLFGTPWAGAVFSLELLRNKSIPWKGLIPAVFTSFMAYYVCILTGALHTHYGEINLLNFSIETLAFLTVSGAVFGLTAWAYIKMHSWFSLLAQTLISNSIWRPFLGGVLLFVIFVFIGDSRYMGLGIPTILETFEHQVLPYDFAVKLLLTALTLGFGFKGGEVTPLFFIGAALGNVLALFLPLPFAFLAALGFLAVFSGATKTFLACAIMGVELFGYECVIYFVFVTFVSQLFSGKASIYKEQPGNRFSIF